MALQPDKIVPPTSGPPVPDLTPEGRRRHALMHRGEPQPAEQEKATGLAHCIDVAKRAALGTWHDGFIHAGNLAYITLFAVFPFFIFGAAVFSALGEEADRAIAIDAVLRALPPSVSRVIGPAARDVIDARSGWLLWAGAAVALWTVGSLVETIRDILRRAYGTKHTKGFWFHRLTSTGIIVGSVLLLLLSLVAQVIIGAAEEVIGTWFPGLVTVLNSLTFSRIVPGAAVYLSIFLLFLSLTPAAYRSKRYPKWPGALLVAIWWVLITALFPPLLSSMFSYSLTYGSLAGIMITLFFFWLIGLGIVAGAELNAALAKTPEEEGTQGNAANSEEEAAQ